MMAQVALKEPKHTDGCSMNEGGLEEKKDVDRKIDYWLRGNYNVEKEEKKIVHEKPFDLTTPVRRN